MQIDFGKVPKWTSTLTYTALMAVNTTLWAYGGHVLSAVFFFVLTLLSAGQTLGDYRSRKT